MKATMKPGSVTVELELSAEEFARLQTLWGKSNYLMPHPIDVREEEIEFYNQAQRLVRHILGKGDGFGE